MLEKKARVETESRLTIEKQLDDVRAQKFDEAAFLLRNASNRYEINVPRVQSASDSRDIL